MLAIATCFVLLLPFSGFLFFQDHGEEFLVGYEVAISCLAAGSLTWALARATHAVHRAKIGLFALGMFSVAIAEAICGTGFLRINTGLRGQSFAEVFYVSFWFCLVALMRWHYGPLNPRHSKTVALIAGGTFLLAYWLQMRFILPTLGPTNPGYLSLANMSAWIFLKSAAVTLALGYSARSMENMHLMFLQSIVALFCAGFSAAHQAVMTGFGTMRWFEAAWAAALGVLLVVAVRCVLPGRSFLVAAPNLSPWYSLRCGMSLSVFAANVAVFAGVALFDMIAIGHALSLSILLLLMLGAWAAANAVALRLSSRMMVALTKPLSGGMSEERAAPLLAEFDRIMCKYMDASEEVAELSRQAAEAETEASIGRITAQVAHDIRSPIAALRMVVASLDQMPHDARDLAQAATERVEQIANNLLTTFKKDKKPKNLAFSLGAMVKQIVAEKRALYAKKPELIFVECIDEKAAEAWVSSDPARTAAALSNILNNAVEVLDLNGTVKIHLCIDRDEVVCQVSDNGRGVPAEILSKLGTKGATFGKENGNGLGLYGARRAMEDAGGSLSIASTVGEGTTLSMRLPLHAIKVPSPESFSTCSSTC